MVRSIRVLGPSAALLVVFTACGGAGDAGLFSGSGGSSAAGASSVAGAGTTPAAGSSSVAGSVNAGGDEATGGDGNAGGSIGGAASGGDSSRAGSGEQGGSGGRAEGGSGGRAEGGSAGHAEGGSAGHAEGGSSAAGASSGGKTGSAGSAGGSAEPTCKDLLAQAATELDAARACNLAQNVLQCTGKVSTTCGCQVPVERSDSAATSEYEATLKQIQAKHCVQACPAIACAPITRAQCRATAAGSTKGMCVASFPLPVGN